MIGLAMVTAVGGLSGGAVADVASVTAITLGCWLTARAAPSGILPLLVLYFPISGLVHEEGRETMERWFRVADLFTTSDADQLSFGISLLGVQISIALVAPLVAAARAGALIIGPASRSKSLRLIAVLAVLALVIAVGSALRGFDAGNNAYSAAPRAVLSVAGFLWGYIVIWRARVPLRSTESDFDVMTTSAALLLGIGAFNAHLIFLAAGLTASAIPNLLFERRYLWLAAASLATAAAFIPGTFTVRSIQVLALITSVVASGRFGVPRRLAPHLIIGAVAIAIVLVSWGIRTAEHRTNAFDEESAVFRLQAGQGAGLGEKLFFDRAPVWRAVWDQSVSDPDFFVPAGRTVAVTVAGQRVDWAFGAHNGALEALRLCGWYGGGLLVLATGAITWLLAGALQSVRVAPVRVVACGVASTIVVGMTTGNFPLQDSTGFLVWALAGTVVAWARRAEQSQPLQSQTVLPRKRAKNNQREAL